VRAGKPFSERSGRGRDLVNACFDVVLVIEREASVIVPRDGDRFSV
jgi:hypothetical protein